MGGLIGYLKYKLCRHNYQIMQLYTRNLRPGTMHVYLQCIKCGQKELLFHDLGEEEIMEFRYPDIEELLIEGGWVIKLPDGKLAISPKVMSYEPSKSKRKKIK